MPDYVRVTDLDTGHKLSILRQELGNGNYRELKAPAVDELGDPIPAEHNAVKPAASEQGQSASVNNTQEK